MTLDEVHTEVERRVRQTLIPALFTAMVRSHTGKSKEHQRTCECEFCCLKREAEYHIRHCVRPTDFEGIWPAGSIYGGGHLRYDQTYWLRHDRRDAIREFYRKKMKELSE